MKMHEMYNFEKKVIVDWGHFIFPHHTMILKFVGKTISSLHEYYIIVCTCNLSSYRGRYPHKI